MLLIVDIIAEINTQVNTSTHGRLFAVIHVSGHQFKVTNEDLILLQTNDRFPDVGTRIILEKVCQLVLSLFIIIPAGNIANFMSATKRIKFTNA